MSQSISSDIVRICKGCGKEFHPHARKQFYCGEIITKTCPVCGSDFQVKCNSSAKLTCSVKCQAEYIKIKRKLSAKQTTRLCKWCGKAFHPNSVRDIYCYDIHYQTCAICGKKFIIDPRKDPYVKTCSLECKNVLSLQNRDIELEQIHRKETLKIKYGVDNVMKIPCNIDKIKQTNRAK